MNWALQPKKKKRVSRKWVSTTYNQVCLFNKNKKKKKKKKQKTKNKKNTNEEKEPTMVNKAKTQRFGFG